MLACVLHVQTKHLPFNFRGKLVESLSRSARCVLCQEMYTLTYNTIQNLIRTLAASSFDIQQAYWQVLMPMAHKLPRACLAISHGMSRLGSQVRTDLCVQRQQPAISGRVARETAPP